MRGKSVKLFEAIRRQNEKNGEYVNYDRLDKEELVRELFRLACLFDNMDIHDHCIETDGDVGWFAVRDILFAAAEMIEKK